MILNSAATERAAK